MKSKLLSLCLMVLFLSPSAMGLTPQERKIIEAAQAQIEIAMQDYTATKTALSNAEQATQDADAHAAATDQAAGVLQTKVDDAYKREKALAADNAKMLPIYKRVTGPWWAPGLGGIIYGVERLSRFILIFIAVAVVLVILLVIFVPAIIPFLEMVGSVVLSFFSMIGAMLSRGLRSLGSLFKKKPASPPPA
jgi:hypothetical protein